MAVERVVTPPSKINKQSNVPGLKGSSNQQQSTMKQFNMPPTAVADSADQATSTATPAADQAHAAAADQALVGTAAADQAPAQVAMQVDDSPGPVTRSRSVASPVHASPFKANKRKAVVTRTAKKLIGGAAASADSTASCDGEAITAGQTCIPPATMPGHNQYRG
uniref:Uncharacterized protein n=1 Tax=Oryza rufipogon TaxID=4529 RepID=A0A0E0NXA7_ORYRU